MKNVMDQHTINEQLQQTLVLMNRFQLNGDQERVKKASGLLRKIHDRYFIIAFSGHFSAGKSSMINALVGENVLPASPIPTSANVVRVHNASDDFAKVHYQSEPPLLFQAPFEFETVKEYCKNGDVQEVEIGRKQSDLPAGVTVMDTPGVDSTDDAHRISTESALHLADVVFYVMDYNHVQSELNFMYTKSLLAHGVKLYLIINQIDKHNDAELSFAQYRKTVEQSFAAWNVHPAGIFFTTLKEKDHPQNEFSTVKMLIEDAFSHQEEWTEKTITAAWNRLVSEHQSWLDEQNAAKAQPLLDHLSEYSQEEQDQLYEREQRLNLKIESLSESSLVWQREYEKDIEALLHNAYLMPFETRELATTYLQAMQPDFKVGLLFSGRKTEEERANRLQMFYDSLAKQVDSQLNWHLRQLAAQQLKNLNLGDEELHAESQNLSVEFQSDLLKETVKKGAGASGDAVLNYCKDVADRIKSVALRACRLFKESVAKKLESRNAEQLAVLKREQEIVNQAAEALRSLESLDQQVNEVKALIHIPLGSEEQLYKKLEAEWVAEHQNVRVYDESFEQKKMEMPIADKRESSSTSEQVVTDSPKRIIEKVNKAVSLLSGDQHFERVIGQLRDKANRLANQQYTIALFGAFSAGKSSFSNALLGEDVLPVSPNPTTAAINRICPPTTEHPHKMVMVKLKEETTMLRDVNDSLKPFGIQSDTLEEAAKIDLQALARKKTSGNEKIHLAFLRAFQAGYEWYAAEKGPFVQTDISGFADYAANEQNACFVESIDLYYDCEFTRKGITLVDTPGADSINARHTGVAFEYIKNADAILFVTYYNHAFSKADREFLIQLGRVKDAFELDKMFFLVNAVDLAHSEEEAEEVISYVESQLIQYGIRHPRIFGISSKLAQSSKTRNKSGIEQFEVEFEHFLENDLVSMAVQATESEYHRLVSLLDRLIEDASQSEEEKARNKSRLLESKQVALRLLDTFHADTLAKRAGQEMTELIYYVKHRVFLRFPDFFKESFNPATLQSKSNLATALEELLQMTGHDFAQELRATSLRVEKYIIQILADKKKEFEHALHQIQPELAFGSYDYRNDPVPDFDRAFASAPRAGMQQTFKYFKNPQAFFEKNEKKQMEEALQTCLTPLADAYLQEEQRKISAYYQQYLSKEFQAMKESMKEDMTDQYQMWIHALEDAGKLADWQRIKAEMATNQ